MLASLVLVFGYVLVICDGQEPVGQPNNGNRLGSTPRRVGGIDPALHRAYVNAFSDGSQQTTTAPVSPWARLAPRLPSPGEIDCVIEVTRIIRYGGRCTRLGGYRSRPFICQSGPYFDFHDDCQEIIANRSAIQQMEPQP